MRTDIHKLITLRSKIIGNYNINSLADFNKRVSYNVYRTYIDYTIFTHSIKHREFIKSGSIIFNY